MDVGRLREERRDYFQDTGLTRMDPLLLHHKQFKQEADSGASTSTNISTVSQCELEAAKQLTQLSHFEDYYFAPHPPSSQQQLGGTAEMKTEDESLVQCDPLSDCKPPLYSRETLATANLAPAAQCDPLSDCKPTLHSLKHPPVLNEVLPLAASVASPALPCTPQLHCIKTENLLGPAAAAAATATLQQPFIKSEPSHEQDAPENDPSKVPHLPRALGQMRLPAQLSTQAGQQKCGIMLRKSYLKPHVTSSPITNLNMHYPVQGRAPYYKKKHKSNIELKKSYCKSPQVYLNNSNTQTIRFIDENKLHSTCIVNINNKGGKNFDNHASKKFPKLMVCVPRLEDWYDGDLKFPDPDQGGGNRIKVELEEEQIPTINQVKNELWDSFEGNSSSTPALATAATEVQTPTFECEHCLRDFTCQLLLQDHKRIVAERRKAKLDVRTSQSNVTDQVSGIDVNLQHDANLGCNKAVGNLITIFNAEPDTINNNTTKISSFLPTIPNVNSVFDPESKSQCCDSTRSQSERDAVQLAACGKKQSVEVRGEARASFTAKILNLEKLQTMSDLDIALEKRFLADSQVIIGNINSKGSVELREIKIEPGLQEQNISASNQQDDFVSPVASSAITENEENTTSETRISQCDKFEATKISYGKSVADASLEGIEVELMNAILGYQLEESEPVLIFYCKKCEKEFDNVESLVTHKREFHFKTFSKYVHKMTAAAGEEDSKVGISCEACHFCGYRALTKCHLEFHRKEHFARKRLDQDVKFNQSSLPIKKARFKYRPQKFNCRTCFRSFTLRSALSQHMNSAHNYVKKPCGIKKESDVSFAVKKVKRFVCTICSKIYRGRHSFNDHLIKSHLPLLGSQIPLKIIRVDPAKNAVDCMGRSYLRMPCNSKKYTCKICNMKLNSKTLAEAHMLKLHCDSDTD